MAACVSEEAVMMKIPHTSSGLRPSLSTSATQRMVERKFHSPTKVVTSSEPWPMSPGGTPAAVKMAGAKYMKALMPVSCSVTDSSMLSRKGLRTLPSHNSTRHTPRPEDEEEDAAASSRFSSHESASGMHTDIMMHASPGTAPTANKILHWVVGSTPEIEKNGMRKKLKFGKEKMRDDLIFFSRNTRSEER